MSQLLEDTKELFSSLQLRAISHDWIEETWSVNFSDKVALPIEALEGLQSYEAWQCALEICHRWTQSNDSEEEETLGNFWTILVDCGVTHKQLLPVVAALQDLQPESAEDYIRAVRVSELYLTILQIQGSHAFKIFHPMIFQRCVDMLKCLEEIPSKTEQAEAQQRPRRGRRPKRRHASEDSSCVMDASESHSVANLSSQSETDKHAIKDAMKYLLKSLVSCLSKVSFQDKDVSRGYLIPILVKLLYVEPCQSTKYIDTPHSSLLVSTPIGGFAWCGLSALCASIHGDQTKFTSEVFNHLLPAVLMTNIDGGGALHPLKEPYTSVSDAAVSFISHCYKKFGDDMEKPFKTIIQHICVKTPDKADYRARLSKVVTDLLMFTSDQLFSFLIDWLYKLSRNTKVSYRVFALDVMSKLIECPPRDLTCPSDDEKKALEQCLLVKAILSRCSDKTASVRTNALSTLAKIGSSANKELLHLLRETISEQVSEETKENLFYPMLRRRAEDEKINVRKAAIQALEVIVRLHIDNVCHSDVQVLRMRCQDPALSVRKQALSSLTALTMDFPLCKLLHSYWLDGVLPMVMDMETSAQEKCASLLEEVILSNITPYDEELVDHEVFVWDLLNIVAGERGQELRRYVKHTCEIWAKQGKLTIRHIKSVITHAKSTANCRAAWMLLSEFVPHVTFMDFTYLEEAWQCAVVQSTQTDPNNDLLKGYILNVISCLASNLPQDLKLSVHGDLRKLLRSFTCSPAVITSSLQAIIKVSEVIPKQKKLLDPFFGEILKECETCLASLLKQERHFEDDAIIAYLFTTGEVAQLCPSQVLDHLCYVIQSLLLASGTKQEGLKEHSMLKLSQEQQLPDLELASIVRAHGFITLGKLCLQNEDVVKNCLLQMNQELEVTENEAIRNNIVLVFCDLIVRYSTKVDIYMPTVAACLKDDSALVRRQTLTLLTHLLQEDYIKWKGTLYFRFVSTLVDDDPELRKYAEFCFTHLLLARYPGMIFSHFTESIFHFNGYEKHRSYNHFHQSEKEKRLFQMKGFAFAGKRLKLYTIFLENLQDEQRLKLTNKLCNEVLGGLVDGAIPLDDEGIPVVKDTLFVLSSKEIKLKSLRKNLVDDLADEGDLIGAAVETARTKALSTIAKKNVIENVIPTVIAAKQLLEKARSPLLKDLMLFLQELMKDYKTEINDLLAADLQLAEEINFDLKKFEDEQQKMTVAASKTPLTTTPHARMVSPLLTPGALGSAVSNKEQKLSSLTPPKLSPRVKRSFQNISVVLTPLPNQGKVVTQVNTPVSKPISTPHVGGGFATPKTVNTLAKAAILASARRTGLPKATPNKAPLPIEYSSKKMMQDNNALTQGTPYFEDNTSVIDGGRLASTPQDLAQNITFHLSSLAPPSPIMVKLSDRDSKEFREASSPPLKRGKKMPSEATVILKEPQKLPKWNIKSKKS